MTQSNYHPHTNQEQTEGDFRNPYFLKLPRNNFALVGNFHAGKRTPPLFQPTGVGAGGPAQGNHAPHGLPEQRPSHTGTFKFSMALSARLSALNFPTL